MPISVQQILSSNLPVGFTGSQGPAGSNGAIGYVGSQGSDGSIGYTGSTSYAITSDVQPDITSNGSIWYNTSDGVAYIYYNDGSSSQWVDASPYDNTPIDLYVGGAQSLYIDLVISGGGAGKSNFPYTKVDGGLADTTIYATDDINITGGTSTTAFELYGQAIDGGVAINRL